MKDNRAMNRNNVYDVAIIGAGISALMLAHNLPDRKVVLLEKSKGIGGRLATRRLQNVPINHGARIINPEHLLLKEIAKIGLEHGFLKMKGEICYPNQGINEWTKFLAKDREILKEYLVYDIFKNNEGLLELRDISGQIMTIAKKIVLSVPAPQANEILKNSCFETSFLLEVKYSSSIQFLAVLESAISIQSVIWDQWELIQETTLPEGYLYHFECKAPFIHESFELDKTFIQNQMLKTLEAEKTYVIDSHIHKWRYSEVSHAISPKFQTALADKNIYLIGDYFYGNDLNAAARSVEAVIKQINC
jgi:hypothetical protein